MSQQQREIQEAGSNWLEQLLAVPVQQTIDVVIENLRFKFRVIQDMSEGMEIQARAEEFADLCERPLQGKYEGVTPCNRQVANLAFMVAETSLSPKMDVVDCLRFAKERGQVFAQLSEVVSRNIQTEMDVKLVAGIDEAKNASSSQSDGETSSQ